MTLKVLALNGTLKTSKSSQRSSTARLLDLIAEEFKSSDAVTETVWLSDHNIKPGVTSDEGEGDAWPEIRTQILNADIILIGTPIWLGQPGSVIKRAL